MSQLRRPNVIAVASLLCLLPLLVAACVAQTPLVASAASRDPEALPSPRPRYSFDGLRLAYQQGEAGARQIIIETLGQEPIALTGQGDNIHPTWTPDGRVVFASNRDGDFDLYVVDSDGASTEQVTDLPGDELEPSVAPVAFGFYAAHNGSCGSPPSGRMFDAYHKVLFTRSAFVRSQGESLMSQKQIWFASLRPRSLPDWVPRGFETSDKLSASATHQGSITKDGAHCHSPTFSGDGLVASYVCDQGGSTLQLAPAEFDQGFEAALKAVKEPPQECQGYDTFEKCQGLLPRRYASYPGKPISKAAQALRKPAFSANQTRLLADNGHEALSVELSATENYWQPLPGVPPAATDLTWSPTGKEVAYSLQGEVRRSSTDFYLQEVRNLHQFPELLAAQKSSKLQKNRFVVRPAEHKEFHVVHDQLRYRKRPQFISSDVALQVFRDEFLRVLEQGERQAAKRLHAFTSALLKHYTGRYARSRAPVDRYYAVLFASAWVPLEAAATMTQPSDEDLLDYQFSRESMSAQERARIEALRMPVAGRLPQEVKRVVAELPAAIRAEVERYVKLMLQHRGIAELSIPARKKPLKDDFGQFRIRGAYAENQLGAYFLAMSWYAALPLVLDESLEAFANSLRQVSVGKDDAFTVWRQIDGVVGALMGRAVDATVEQLLELHRRQSGWFQPFDRGRVSEALLEARGEVAIRDASGEDRKIAITLFPKRIGLDVTFFRQLTHRPVPERGMPSALDVFATLGNRRAVRYASQQEPAKIQSAYQQALKRLNKANQPLATTDIYHAWLAVLVALAEPAKVPATSLLEFAKSEAWADKQLHSALAGYTQLKHSTVLYAMQDMGVECDGETSYYVAVEQPLIPPPRGFVEPHDRFYTLLSDLAGKVYARLWAAEDGAREPNAMQWREAGEPALNAKNFAGRLAVISRRELAGHALSTEDYEWIQFVGGELESLALGMQPGSHSFSTGGQGRQERGVALVTDIHTNTDRQQALQIGIGRIFDLWVAVPAEVGQQLTQGGILSFYEFTSPMNARLTDGAWGQRVGQGPLPKRPEWTRSFIEP